jgi:glycosyltransferase involved in cell wall biosynthesis
MSFASAFFIAKMPNVSIIMPVRNAGKWIQATLDSILKQSMVDWELIAVLDDSTDDSELILQALACNDERLKIYSSPKKGIIPTLQFALEKSTGTYISRMDADDIMPSERLSIMLAAVPQEKNPFVVTGLVNYFSDAELSVGYQNYENWLNERVLHKDHYDHIYRECIIASPNWLCRRSDLHDYSIFDDLIYPEDYHITFKWYAQNFRIISINRSTLLWREHPERTSRTSVHYQQKSFFHLKIKQWAENEYQQGDSVAVLGKGQKAKLCLDILQSEGINALQYVQESLERPSESDPIAVSELFENKLLIAVYPKEEERKILTDFLVSRKYMIGKNAWFV